ncbi:MAG: hypothetical protein QOE63_247, partial [Acidimicrobiaceae bacterium]
MTSRMRPTIAKLLRRLTLLGVG